MLLMVVTVNNEQTTSVASTWIAAKAARIAAVKTSFATK